MHRSAFRDIATAPKDGTLIEVRHGPDQEIVRAEWAGQNQAWIRVDDPLRRTLHRVTGWRPPIGRAGAVTGSDQTTAHAPATVPAEIKPTGKPTLVTARKPRPHRV